MHFHEVMLLPIHLLSLCPAQMSLPCSQLSETLKLNPGHAFSLSHHSSTKGSRSGTVICHHMPLCESGETWERAQAPQYPPASGYSSCVNVTKVTFSLRESLVRVNFHLHPLVVPLSFALGTQPTFLGLVGNDIKGDHYCVFGLPPACWHQPFATNPYPSCPHMPILSKQLPTAQRL